MGKLNDLLAEWLYDAYEYFMSSGGANIDYLKIDGNLIHFSEALWHFVAIFATGFTFIYFLWDLNQKMLLEGRDTNYKSLLIPFTKCALAFAILSHSPGIISDVIGFYNATLDKVHDWDVMLDGSIDAGGAAGDTGGESGEEVLSAEEIKAAEEERRAVIRSSMGNVGIFEVLGLLPIALIMWLLQMLLRIIWNYKAIVFKLEMLWRIGVTPVALADCYNGFNSGSIRWLKQLMGLAIYAAAFVLIPKMGGDLLQTNTTANLLDFFSFHAGEAADTAGEAFRTGVAGFFHNFEGLVLFIVMPFAELGVLGAIKQATKEAFN